MKNTDLITFFFHAVGVFISQCARKKGISIYPYISLLDPAKGSINILPLKNENKW